MDRVYRVYNETQLEKALREIASIANDPKKLLVIENEKTSVNNENTDNEKGVENNSVKSNEVEQSNVADNATPDNTTFDNIEPTVINRYPRIRIFEDNEWESDVTYDVDNNAFIVGINGNMYDYVEENSRDLARKIIQDARQKVFEMTNKSGVR